MKKLLYITCWNITGNEKSCGVMQKMLSQAKAFSTYGYEVTLFARTGNQLCTYHVPQKDKMQKTLKTSKVWPVRKSFYEEIVKQIEGQRFDAVYIRYPLADMFFVHMLQRLSKTQRNHAKIICEIPTYPYEAECKKSTKLQTMLLLDRHFRTQLKYYIDYFVVFGEEKSIYDIPTIRTENGIDVDHYPVRRMNSSKHGKEKMLKLLGVASMTHSHGYDRVIKGLYEYKKSASESSWKILIDLVGEGEELDNYKQLMREYGLENDVTFHGRLQQSELAEYYDQADLGLECLGLFRNNIEWSSSLKSREYVAKGLPFITANKIIGLPSEAPWVYYVPGDETPIKMQSLIEFYMYLQNMGLEKVAQQMHDWAEENFAMQSVLAPVVLKFQ